MAHAGQQTVELIVAQVDLLGEELADAWLTHAAEARQFGLGGACLVHHRPQHLTPIAHTPVIAQATIIGNRPIRASSRREQVRDPRPRVIKVIIVSVVRDATGDKVAESS
jgi:hypothetical protein